MASGLNFGSAAVDYFPNESRDSTEWVQPILMLVCAPIIYLVPAPPSHADMDSTDHWEFEQDDKGRCRLIDGRLTVWEESSHRLKHTTYDFLASERK